MHLDVRTTLLDSLLSTVRFVLLDLESTGLKPEEDRICEVALVIWQDGQIVGAYQALIKSERPIAPDAYAVNRITPEMLADAPAFVDVIDPLLDLIGDGVLVAHNASFDVCFLNAELIRAGRAPLNNPVVDTLALARNFLDYDRYNLGALASNLGISPPEHRAMSDVQALIALFAHLLRHLLPLGVETLDDLLRAQRGLLPGDGEPIANPVILQALRDGRRLHIAYRTNGGAPVSRDILPLELQMASGLPRIVAFCFLRNAQRTFYIDRIADLVLIEE